MATTASTTVVPPAQARRRRHRPRRMRPVRIADIGLSAAVVAVGLQWARAYWGRLLASIPLLSWRYGTGPIRSTWIIGGDPFYDSARDAATLLIMVGTTLAATGSVALVLARRWHHPTAATPCWRARRPGALASLITVLILGGTLGWQAARPSRQDRVHTLIGPAGEVRIVATAYEHDGVLDDRRESRDPLLNTPLQMPRWTGFVVAGAWLVLVLSGTWRGERSAVDRLGRLIGVFWIAAALYFLFLPL